MKLVFENNNIYDGLRNALFFIKSFTSSRDVILYKKNIDNSFQTLSFNSNSELTDFNDITLILNRIEKHLSSRDYLDFDVQAKSCISHIVYLKIVIDGEMYVLALPDMNKEMTSIFDLLKEVLAIVISNVKRYEKMLIYRPALCRSTVDMGRSGCCYHGRRNS